LTRKQSDKNKSGFFGDHLEITPSFMQRPKSLDEVMSEAFSNSPPPSIPSVESHTTEALDSTDNLIEPNTNAHNSSDALNSTVANFATTAQLSPVRLQAEVSRLKNAIEEDWKPLPHHIKTSLNYWRGYSEAWHWLEDRLLPSLDKDLKLTFRRCFRKAFGKPDTEGKFFTGQTALAKEVGLSKRRIQDILEIFNMLGWVRKVAHYNRGGLKGTDYEMYLPSKVIDIFTEESNKP
jgi:hypothetical protein